MNLEHRAQALERSSICEEAIERNPGKPEFHQAVREDVESLSPVLDKHPEFVEKRRLSKGSANQTAK